MRTMSARILAVCLAAACFGGGTAAAQRGDRKAPAPGQPPAQSENEGFFLDSVNVSVVNVDVHVTDKKGNRVTGLTKDDFEIFEDGRPVAVTNFYAVEGGKAAASSDPEPAPAEVLASQPP